jgi:hypothetical protein
VTVDTAFDLDLRRSWLLNGHGRSADGQNTSINASAMAGVVLPILVGDLQQFVKSVSRRRHSIDQPRRDSITQNDAGSEIFNVTINSAADLKVASASVAPRQQRHRRYATAVGGGATATTAPSAPWRRMSRSR